MDRLSRVVSIMIDLINHDFVSAKYLSEKYEVSTRTIYRDIELLNLSGIPILSKKGLNGGFYVLEGFKIDRSIVSESEFSILLRGLQTLINNHDKEAKGVYDKLVSILTDSRKEKILQASHNVIIDVTPFEKREKLEEYYRIIQMAIKEQQCLNVIYQSIEKGVTKRKIEPIRLIYKSTSWYLYAYCKTKKDFRSFKLERIKKLELLEETYQQRIEEGSLLLEEKYKVTQIVIKTSKQYADFIKEYHHIVDSYEEKDQVVLVMQYPLDNWVYSTLLSFGENVEVIHPKIVKDELINKINQMGKIYRGEANVE